MSTQEGAQNTQAREELFNRIKAKVLTRFTADHIASYKTSKGDTQNSERRVIADVKSILNEENLTYKEAGSQQPKDFRNVGGIGLDIEVKKTDSETVVFNDTCPAKDVYYLVFFTGKQKGRKNKRTVVPPQVVCVNGYEFVKDSPWIEEYQAAINALKDKYARGEGKKQLSGMMSVYPRPTYRADIATLLETTE